MAKIETKQVDLYYGDFHALKGVTISIEPNTVTAFIGPSGCGKSTYLRLFNRMNDLIDNVKITGFVMVDGQDIYDKRTDVDELRKKVGMVFQKPNPFPKSIFENVAYGLKVRGVKKRTFIESRVEKSLVQAGLWNEVKDRLHSSATSLSGGQQQRVCIARALATDPEILLLDEPTSALDPISTGHIEELISELKKDVTIVIVTHNLHQAARCSDFTAFMYLGNLIEFNASEKIFTTPKDQRTENYITGRFG